MKVSENQDLGARRPEGCVSRFRLERFRAGELEGAEANHLRAHLETCPTCQVLLETLETEKAAFRRDWPFERFMGALEPRLEREGFTLTLDEESAKEGLTLSSNEESAKSGIAEDPFPLRGLVVDPELEAEAEHRFGDLRRPSESWYAKSLELVTAFFRSFFDVRWIGLIAVAIALLVILPKNQEQTPEDGPQFRSGVIEPGVFEVYLLREGEIRPAQSGEVFHEGDQIQFVVHTGSRAHLHLFSLDATGRLTWFYPQDGGFSMPLALNAEIFLPGSIQLDDYVGLERIFAIYTKDSIHDSQLRSQVEKLLRAHERPLPLDRIEQLDIPDASQQTFLMVKE